MNLLLPGPYPRSEHLVSVSRDYDRQRATHHDLKLAWQDEILEYRELQKGFEYISTGLFQWQDLLRPFVHLIPGAESDGLQRFYETNTFWRKVEFAYEPSLDNETLEEWISEYIFSEGLFKPADPLLFTLPFLFNFKDFSSGADDTHIGLLLEKIACKILSFPRKALCFFDPTFGWRPLSDEEKLLGKELILAIKQKTQAPIYLWSCFFSLKHDADYLFSLPVDGFGIDFYSNSIDEVLMNFPADKMLLAGIINTQSTLMESKAAIESFISRVTARIPEEKLYIIPNAPAELLPRQVMDNKIKNIQEFLLCQTRPIF